MSETRNKNKYDSIAVESLILLVLVFEILNHNFLSIFNISNLFNQNAYFFVLMTGIAIVMIGGGIDFSIGYQMSLVAVIMGILFQNGIPVVPTVLIGLSAGTLCGLLNGVIIAYFEISPIIVTLITQVFFKGISYQLSKGQTFSNFPTSFSDHTVMITAGVSMFLIMIVAVCIVFALFLFRFTMFGKEIIALGENEILAGRIGIRTKRVKVLMFCLAGFFAALAVMLLISRQGMANSQMGVGLELNAIFAAYISNGAKNTINVHGNNRRGSVIDFYLGALIIIIIDNGIQISGGGQYIKYCITAAIMLLSIIIERKYHQNPGKLRKVYYRNKNNTTNSN